MSRVAQKHYSSQNKVNVLLLLLISQLNVNVAQFEPLGFTVCHFVHIQVHKTSDAKIAAQLKTGCGHKFVVSLLIM